MTVERDRLVKLVRDDVGSYLGANTSVSYKRMSREDHIEGLRKKLIEEACEYAANPCEAELADVLEVSRALAEQDLARSWGRIEAVAQEKRETHGGFDRGIGMFVQTTEVPLGDEAAQRIRARSVADPQTRGECPTHRWMGRVAGSEGPCPHCEDAKDEAAERLLATILCSDLQALIAPVLVRYYAVGRDPDDPEDEVVTQAWEVAEEAARVIRSALSAGGGVGEDGKPEEVEAEAMGLWKADGAPGGGMWGDLRGVAKAKYRVYARFVLAAATNQEKADG